jgi:hypothetical protein
MRRETKDIIALAKTGLAPRDIALKVGVEPTTVHSALRYARLKGHNIPLFSTNSAPIPPEDQGASQKMLVVPIRLHTLLTREAERRGKTPAELAQGFLEAGLLRGAGSPANSFQKIAKTETSNV